VQSLGRYVNEAVKALNAQKAIEFHHLKEAWLQAVGPVLAGQAEPTRLRSGVLHVTVSSPAWSQEIQMQQRLILARLKSILRKAPTKIACWVGQPYQSGAPHRGNRRKAATNEQVPWANQTIPPSRQTAIEETLAGLAEESQRVKLRPLIELSVKRELYFLELGQLPCPVCGCMRPLEQQSCDQCERERAEQAERKLLRLMARKPWLKIRDIQDVAPWAGRAQLIRLKKTLRTNLLQQAWQLSEGTEGEELASKMTPAYAKLLLDIAMLTCGLRKDSLKPRHFQYALGQRLAKAYLSSCTEQPSEEPG
jgi:hypothetical protein